MIELMQLADDAPRMIVDLSYMKDPNWWGRNQTAPEAHEFKDTFSQIDRHRDTASRLIELAAWNMRQAELLANKETL